MKNLQSLFICIALLFAVGLGCGSPSSDTTRPSTDTTRPSTNSDDAITASPSGRRKVAKQLQSAVVEYDKGSIYTKGDDDEILYIGSLVSSYKLNRFNCLETSSAEFCNADSVSS